MIIRKANLDDFPAIFSLISDFASFQKTPEKLHITLEQMIADASLFQCFVAEDADGTIAGFTSFFFAYYSWSGKALYLDDLYVGETHRNQGIGNALLDAVIAYARANHCIKLRWQVSNWNTAAIAFYTSRGATVDDVELNCDLNLAVI